MYQAKTLRPPSIADHCDSAACSIGRNGPTSCPLGLITPIVPATRSSHQLPGGREDDAGRRHQPGAEDEGPAAAEAVGAGGQNEGDDGIADEGGRQQQPGVRFVDAEADQIEHQHDRQGAVGEQTDEPRHEQQPCVAG